MSEVQFYAKQFTIGANTRGKETAKQNNAIADRLFASGAFQNTFTDKAALKRLEAKKEEYQRTGNRQGYDTVSALLFNFTNKATAPVGTVSNNEAKKLDSMNFFA